MGISFSRSFLLIFANEALRVVRGPGPFILRDLRIRAQRPGSDNLSVTALRGPNLFWRDTLLDPLDQRGQKVALIRTDPAAAMGHPRNHKQPEEFRGRWPEARAHLLVIIDAHQRIQRRVGPAEIHNDLPAARFEAAEIRILRVEDVADRLKPRKIGFEIERLEVVIGIGLRKSEIAKEALGEVVRDRASGGRGRDDPVGPDALRGRPDFGPDRLPPEDALAAALGPAIDDVERANLRRSEAVFSVNVARANRQIFGRIEIAASRIANQSVYQAVGAVAFRVDTFCDDLQLF